MQVQNSALIISVPFKRNARFLLSSELFARMKKEFNILIVSPFADDGQFREEFGGSNVRFLRCDDGLSLLEPFYQRVFEISELVRFNGYWFRFRNNKMKYYWHLIKSGYDECSQKAKSRKARILGVLLGYVGCCKLTWRLIDIIFGKHFYNVSKLHEITRAYTNVTVVQTANWGYQERFLSFFAKKYSHKTIFVPYTTDQLSINGYLIADFDMICTQGPIESMYVQQYHAIDNRRTFPLGMIWNRNIEAISKDFPLVGHNNPNRTILYAGVSSLYFSRVSEFEAVDEILRHIKSGSLANIKLIYRPVAKDQEELVEIQLKYGGNHLIEVQLPQAAMIGMGNVDVESSSVKSEIIEYLKVMSNIDLLIMSSITTLMFDAMYFSVPVISNFNDPVESSRQNGKELILSSDVLGVVSSGLHIVHSTDDMMKEIYSALENADEFVKSEMQILSDWDFHNNNYIEDFMQIINRVSA